MHQRPAPQGIGFRARRIAVALAVSLAAFASAQGDATDTLDFPPDIVGAAEMAQFSGDGGRCPLRVEFMANATTNTNCTITYAQYETYSPSAQFFSPVNNIINQSSWQSTSGLTRRFFPFDEWWNWRNTNANQPQRQWGRFYCELKVGNTVKKRWEWTVTPGNINNIGGFASGGSGGPGNPGGVGTGTNPSDTGGFWAGLFVPSEESLNAFKNKLQEISEWGPLGIYKVIANQAKSQFDNSTTNHLADDLNTPYKIPIKIPNFNQQANSTGYWTYLDLSPWEPYIKFVRLIMTGFLWWSAMRYIWRRVEKKI